MMLVYEELAMVHFVIDTEIYSVVTGGENMVLTSPIGRLRLVGILEGISFYCCWALLCR